MKPALQIAFLTGQSRPASCALSPMQHAFLQRLADETGGTPVERNFPYADATPGWRPTPLLRASVNNFAQFLGARRAKFRLRHRDAVLALVARADRTVFLAGSCGLELLRRLELPVEALDRVRFIAYGPVARRRPACVGIVVQGRRDWMSRVLSPRPDHELACGHLGYLAAENFARICTDFVARQHEPEAVTHGAAF